MTSASASAGPTLTFVIPVRHPDNARDWNQLKANLAQTIRSIAAQTSDDWRGVIVANEGADIPPVPARFHVERVDFAPNAMHELEAGRKEDFLNAFRLDKGRRVLTGMLTQRDSRYFMIVDDDDFVSNALVSFLSPGHAGPGFKVDQGYVWNDGGAWLYAHNDFNHICGTSLVIRSDVYDLPDTMEQASEQFVMAMLGSHHGVDALLEERGTPLAPLGFRGAVYRVANPGSHSQTPGFLRKYVLTGDWYRYPRTTLRKFLRIKRIGPAEQGEFFGRPT